MFNKSPVIHSFGFGIRESKTTRTNNYFGMDILVLSTPLHKIDGEKKINKCMKNEEEEEKLGNHPNPQTHTHILT